MVDARMYLNGVDFSGTIGEFEFTELAKKKLESQSLRLDESLTLEFESHPAIDRLWDMMVKDHVRKQNYAISLCLMNGFGCIEVRHADFTEWYMAPRVPYRQLMKMPYEAFDVLDKMTYGARRIEV